MKKKIAVFALLAAMVLALTGCFVDYEEGFFICPECGEPIYACDWQGHDFSTCPVCEFEMEDA